MGTFKNITRKWIQQLLGFRRYLFIFSRFNIFRVRLLKQEKAFRYFTTLIKEEGAILDIGANIGVMTVHLAMEHPASSIYAFEPVPENYRTLERIISFYHLSNVQVYKTALGDTGGEIKMIMPKIAGSRMQGLSHVFDESKDNGSAGNIYTVPVQSLDSIPGLQQLAKISAIKIDVENFELQVLKGGEALLRKHRPVIFCELWNNKMRTQCVDWISGLGYRIMVLENGRLQDHTNQDALNYFFLPL